MFHAKRLVLAHFWLAFIAFIVALFLGAWQMLVRSPLVPWIGDPELYYQASTVPAASRPGITGKATGIISCRYPARIFQSIGLTLAASTRMRTCPGPACGSAASSTRNTVGSPYWW